MRLLPLSLLGFKSRKERSEPIYNDFVNDQAQTQFQIPEGTV